MFIFSRKNGIFSETINLFLKKYSRDEKLLPISKIVIKIRLVLAVDPPDLTFQAGLPDFLGAAYQTRHFKQGCQILLWCSIPNQTFQAGLPDFSWRSIPEREIIHHMTTKMANGL
jgi:hypothetical protein